ncbi:MAG: trypsin-like peptidase domain-containing protein [Deltaproteobacteria bacterium]|nr:trypsin-like peptidase domain-containing protein [Deltaproteobacteria bacterium]
MRFSVVSCSVLWIIYCIFSVLHAAIYSEDSRKDYRDVESSALRELFASVAMIASEDALTNYRQLRSLARSYRLSEAVPFGEQTVFGFCSAFLISADIVMTAGHCVLLTPYFCSDSVFVFAYHNGISFSPEIKGNDVVYRCKEVLDVQLDDERDFALIRLDRKTQRKSLKLSTTDHEEGGDIFSVSHPHGILAKYSSGTILGRHGQTIYAALDVFRGSSGAPVFNSEHHVIGLVRSGGHDFEKDEDGESYRLRITEDLEDITSYEKISDIRAVSARWANQLIL